MSDINNKPFDNPFDQASNDAYQLMHSLYELRYRYPPEKYPEVWALVPEAQVWLSKIQQNINLARKAVNG